MIPLGGVKLEFPKLDQRWNDYCQNFWQRTEWQEYILSARFGVEYKNHSFFVGQNGEIIGIVPLIQEDDQFTFQGGATPAYTCKPEHEKFVLAEIRRLALENDVKRVHVRGHVRGYLDASTYTCIIDPANIDPSKGHKAAIKKGEKYLTWEATTDINQFAQDYFRIAGKETRPIKTFYILGDFISQGLGTLLKAKHKDKTAGYAYILHWRDWAYYSIAAVEPEFKEYNVSHYLQSVAFGLLKDKGIRTYELGEQVYSTLLQQPSEKEKNISLFKRGFGGQAVISPASEYFFDPVFARATIMERLKNYLEAEYEKSPVFPET